MLRILEKCKSIKIYQKLFEQSFKVPLLGDLGGERRRIKRNTPFTKACLQGVCINILSLFIIILLPLTSFAQKPKPVKPIPPISQGTDGKLIYTTDSLGNRIPDFSYCGYMAGEQAIPDVPIKVIVPVKEGDATLRIQSSIDYLASLPADNKGIRGAILFEKGTYKVQGYLKIHTSGIILRGSGMGKDGTIILGAGKDRQTLIAVSGKNDRRTEKEIVIKDPYVPVNATKIKLSATNSLKVGDMVLIHRPDTKEWIQKLGTDHFGGGITSLGWKPGNQHICWDRKIISIDNNIITINAPITTAIDTTYGNGYISKYTWPGRISQIGIENLRLISEYDINNPKDEEHRWMAITIENVCDAWVRQVVFEHFAGSAVAVWENAKQITVEDCKSLSPISEIGGQRRNTFWSTGQQTLFQRLYSENGHHEFAVGFCAPGPNAFVQCEAYLPYSFSGCIDSWASGVLFDIVNIDGNALRYANLGQDLQGAGWNAANSVFWNCSAARVDCYKPPTANNWAFGTWAQFSGDGYWGESNNHINPRSLYYAQLTDRLGENVKNRAFLLEVQTEATSSPNVDQALALTKEAIKAHLQLSEFIDLASQRQPISTFATNIKSIDQIGNKTPTQSLNIEETKISDGWLIRGNFILTGNRIDAPWWSGSIKPNGLIKANHAITRFVPGRNGKGLTDDLSEMTNSMVHKHIVAFEQNYALWYERRRDDHERIRRMDGDVWPPFYEVPFARSGQGSAWDGLSLYDLAKYNHWYWMRLKQFAGLADQKGLVLVHQNYFQHNIIEAGAHWADFPWRSANNINNTGFPEPPPYAGDKRIFMAEQFYDTTHPVRNELHKAYIRKCLDNFADNTAVIQFISAEFTGPYHFVKFWLETIRDWEKETGKKPIIGLSVSKDVQDSVLANPSLASVVDLIDIRYWSYKDDGTVYAPFGGQNLAPRQHARLVKPGKRSFEQTYRAVREYKQKFPEMAVMYSEDGWDRFGWAVFMAGGSLACIPPIAEPKFLIDAANMKPFDFGNNSKEQWALANPGKGYIIYNNSAYPVKIDLNGYSGNFIIRRINPASGLMLENDEKIKGGRVVEIKNNLAYQIVWISKL